MHDLIIIGGGPAGLAGAAFAIRKRLDVLLVSPGLGGRTNRRLALPWVDDYDVMLGEEVVQRFRSQLQYLDFMRVRTKAEKIEPLEGGFSVTVSDGKSYATRTVLYAAGSVGKFMNIPGEAEFEMKGLCYSTATYAPLFIDRQTVVIGDGDLALRAVAELQRIASHVTLIAGNDNVMQTELGQRLEAESNVTFLLNHEIIEIKGDDFVRKVEVKDGDRGFEVNTEAVFVEQFLTPNTGILKGLVELDETGFIKIDERNRTSVPGLYAAGDVTTAYSDQLLISVGEGAKAVLTIYDDLLGVGS